MTSSACLNKPNSIEKAILPLISIPYKKSLETLLKKDPQLLQTHKLSLIKFDLVLKSIKSRHPLVKEDFQKRRTDVFYTFMKKLDGLDIFFTEEDISSLIKSVPEEELNLLVPPIFFFKLVEQKTKERIQELLPIKELFLKEKFSFSEERSFYLGDDPPKSLSKLQLVNNWTTYLGAILTQIALEKNYTTSEAIKNEKFLKEELKSFINNLIQTYQDNLNEPQFLTNLYLNTLLNSLDEYSNYLSPEVSDGFSRKLSLDSLSLGFNYRVDINNLTVTEVFEPASSAGLNIGDKITKVAIKDKVYSYSNLSKFLNLLAAPPEAELKLIVQRDTATLGISIIPKTIANSEKSIQYFLFKDNQNTNLAYIKIPQFYYGVSKESDKLENKLLHIILNLESLGVKGLILDLQNNGGGSFPAVFQVLSLFLPQGPVLQEKNKDQTVVHRLEAHDFTYSGKVVVLINKQSASSSEILANALQERKRAIIVGSPSFGKGTIQEVINLGKIISPYPDLAAYQNQVGDVKVTRASFHKLNGEALHNKGVTPDIMIPTIQSINYSAKKIDFPTLNLIKVSDKDIAEISILKEKSLKRQFKLPVFNSITKMNEEEKQLAIQEEWIFNNLNTMRTIKDRRDNLEKNKKSIKVKTKFSLIEEDLNPDSIFSQVKEDAVIQESMEILSDYVNH